ncbi:T9SS type A sorting domain-containing protein, partial [candidate division WOR-3 bacterium]|nr:T9SS type A sorting domain-containing protein [candidate division WOR-3 bacterium]
VGGILGNPPKILRSTDMGMTWTKISNPANSSLLKTIYKSGIFYTVGHCGSILKSIDNGITWIKIDNSITVNDLFAIDFPQNGNIGYASGKLGTVLKSTNSGSTWTLQTTPVNSILFGISFFDGTYGIAVGGEPSDPSGYIIYTTNAGQNWCLANVNLNTVMYDVEYVSFNNAVAVGSNGTIMKSTDHGYNWKKVNLDNPISNHLRRICFVDNNNGFICGTDGIFLKTEDGGDSWSQIQTGLSILHVMDFCTPSVGVVGNVDEDIYKTTNGGKTWQLILEKEEIYNLKQVAMPNQNVIIVEYIYGAQGYVPPSLTHKFYCSYDGGASWVDYDCPVNWPLDFFYNPVNNTMITCGYFGEIRYKNDFLNTDYISTSDTYESLTSQIPNTGDDIRLIYNSMSEKYIINVFNSSNKHYSYNIFDLSGRIITNANGSITSDNQSIQLNTENLSSGSFFLVFNVGNHSINRKFTIVR